MEPITTWSIATIATIIATKGLEKSGEKLGEGVMKLGSHLLSLLKQKAPETATAIEQAPTQLDEQQATALSQQVEQAAIAHPEVKLAAEALAANPEARQIVEALAAMAKENQQGWTIENWKGINIKGGENTISGNTLNF
ncbi:hypothetical protein [Stenomitos frigidus]|uniref:Uncharacterized protein n=1 Tax=Stenomitos frigidus ULC18 TaxID=2107698 RepID=A0A2T1EDC5_9CYAN|nr:hypothetical protein [Stenomitos frigidus]PSB30757.1 hypothetical protein C7B82_08040 [Stenomitos frigidus ULC18]